MLLLTTDRAARLPLRVIVHRSAAATKRAAPGFRSMPNRHDAPRDAGAMNLLLSQLCRHNRCGDWRIDDYRERLPGRPAIHPKACEEMRKTQLTLVLLCLVIAGCATEQKAPPTTPPPAQAGYELSLLKIPVSNIKRSADFYRNTLGFHQQSVAEQYGWAQFQADRLSVALYK